MNRKHLLAATFISAALALAANSAFAAVTAPYSQDFSGGASDFTPASLTTGSSSAVWNAASGTYTTTITRVSGASFYDYSSVQASNLPLGSPANSGFEVSTLLENMSIGDTSANVTDGLRFLADTTNSNTNAYAVDVNLGLNAGRVRLVRWTSGSSKVYPDATQANQLLINNFHVGDPYKLDVFGSYNSAGLLDLQVQITDMNHPTDLAGFGLPLTDFTHTGVNGEYGSSPSTGTYFGYLLSTSSGTNTTISSTFDNFTIATPEPGSLGLLAVAGLALIRRRRA
jgi:hypothetical protein